LTLTRGIYGELLVGDTHPTKIIGGQFKHCIDIVSVECLDKVLDGFFITGR
jgi:hypothetical protein